MSAALSVLIPVKNGMPWLPETLASLAAQTFRDFDLLVWDNGSTDGTLDELRRWIPHRLAGRIVADRPLPLGLCRAAMVQAAKTELCAWIDADDLCRPDRFALQVGFMKEHPRVAVLSANLDLIDARGALIPGAPRYATDDAEIRWGLRFANTMAQGAAIFRRSALLAAGNYRDIAPGQDYDMWLRVAKMAPLANLPQVLILYRRHTTNITRNETHQSSRELRRRIVEMNIEALFPGMSGGDVRRLYHVLATPEDLGVTLQDIRLLHRAASVAAVACGEDPAYFRRCTLYKAQRLNLWTRWMKNRRAVKPVWPLLRGAARLVGPFPNRGPQAAAPLKEAA